MRTDEFGFNRELQACTRLDMSRKAGVSRLEVSSLSSGRNNVT